jgi:hypothetical protein
MRYSSDQESNAQKGQDHEGQCCRTVPNTTQEAKAQSKPRAQLEAEAHTEAGADSEVGVGLYSDSDSDP